MRFNGTNRLAVFDILVPDDKTQTVPTTFVLRPPSFAEVPAWPEILRRSENISVKKFRTSFSVKDKFMTTSQ